MKHLKMHEGDSAVVHGRSPSANVINPEVRGVGAFAKWGPGDHPLAAGGLFFSGSGLHRHWLHGLGQVLSGQIDIDLFAEIPQRFVVS